MNILSKDLFCEQCKGRCWDEKNNSKTQRIAYTIFGIIPNNCVNGEGGVIHCPYATKQ